MLIGPSNASSGPSGIGIDERMRPSEGQNVPCGVDPSEVVLSNESKSMLVLIRQGRRWRPSYRKQTKGQSRSNPELEDAGQFVVRGSGLSLCLGRGLGTLWERGLETRGVTFGEFILGRHDEAMKGADVSTRNDG